MDLDLRKLRYFLALAEHLNFTRAAEALHIAQPVLSRQITALERELGTALFVRDKQRTVLTVAGGQLLDDAPSLLAAAAATCRRVLDAARERHLFTVGFMPGLTVTAAARQMRSSHPDLQINVIRTGWDNQVQLILDGHVDVGFIRLPVDESRLAMEHLFEEPRVVLLPTDHRLAAAPTVTLDQLASEHLLQDPSAVPEWRAVASEMTRSPHHDHLAVRTVEEKVELVASGEGIVILPRTAARFYRRQDIVVKEMPGLAPTRVALAWEARRTTALITEFVAYAKASARDPGGDAANDSDGPHRQEFD